MIHALLMFVPFSRLASALCQITPPRKVIGVKSASKINSTTNSNSYVAYYMLQLSRLRKEPKTWLTGGISSLRKHINRYFPLRFTSCMHLTGISSNWDTHGNTYKTKCEEQGIAMYPGVEPSPKHTTEGPQNVKITPFMQSKPPKWTKEGLLEHIVELVVLEDKV